MGRPPVWAAALTGRAVMRSPGRPPVRRDLERAFWARIAEGLTTEEPATACGVSGPVATRWFRHAGGMPPIELTPASGRYLSFTEREDIALLRAKGMSMRDVAARLGRSPSTISRELRRNAATRGGKLRGQPQCFVRRIEAGPSHYPGWSYRGSGRSRVATSSGLSRQPISKRTFLLAAASLEFRSGTQATDKAALLIQSFRRPGGRNVASRVSG